MDFLQSDPFQAIILFGLFLKICGFGFRDELYLRLLVAAGMGCDVIYFTQIENGGLLPIFSSAIIIAINAVLIVYIIRERTTIAMSDEEKRLFEAFSSLSPGQFRRILKIASWEKAEVNSQLTREGEQADALYYIFSSTFRVHKKDHTYKAKGPAFIGEISFLLETGASADVTVAVGAEYVRFPQKDLRTLMKKSRPFENAIMSLISKDLALKTANSAPIYPPIIVPDGTPAEPSEKNGSAGVK